MRNTLHKFLYLNPAQHADTTLGFFVLSVVVGAVILSVAAVFLNAAEAGVFSGPL